MSDFLGAAAFVLAVVIGFMALIIVPAYFVERATCRAKAGVMGVEQTFGILQGCAVKIGGEWIPLENYRGQSQLEPRK